MLIDRQTDRQSHKQTLLKTVSPWLRVFTGCFPAKYKHAVVIPLLKKDNLDVSQLKNYRPVSNLTFVSKLLERIVQTQLVNYLTEHD